MIQRNNQGFRSPNFSPAILVRDSECQVCAYWTCFPQSIHNLIHFIVNPNIILVKIKQLSWWARSLNWLTHQDNCCESHQFNSGIYMLTMNDLQQTELVKVRR